MVASCNYIDAKSYTDGFVTGPMFDQTSQLLKCPNCDALIWLEDISLRPLSESEQAKDNEYGELLDRLLDEPVKGDSRWAILKDLEKSIPPYAYGTAIDQKLVGRALKKTIWRTPEEEKYIRIRVWWKSNHPYRKYSSKYFDLVEKLVDLLARKLEPLDLTDPDKVEMFRELGRLEERGAAWKEDFLRRIFSGSQSETSSDKLSELLDSINPYEGLPTHLIFRYMGGDLGSRDREEIPKDCDMLAVGTAYLNRLLSLLDATKPDEALTRAEILRELGRLEERDCYRKESLKNGDLVSELLKSLDAADPDDALFKEEVHRALTELEEDSTDQKDTLELGELTAKEITNLKKVLELLDKTQPDEDLLRAEILCELSREGEYNGVQKSYDLAAKSTKILEEIWKPLENSTNPTVPLLIEKILHELARRENGERYSKEILKRRNLAAGKRKNLKRLARFVDAADPSDALLKDQILRLFRVVGERSRERKEILKNQDFTAEETANLERLLSLFDSTKPGEALYRAEILRELRRFEECISELRRPFEGGYLRTAPAIKVLAEKRDWLVDEIG
jgi:hypothetical protein